MRLIVWLGIMTLCFVNEQTGQSVQVTDEKVYSGMCDASAGIALTEDIFIAADDESNVLHKYSRSGPSKPLQLIPLGRFLQADRKHPEADVEGAARVGDVVYWITSHGRNKDGELRPSRQRFFASKVAGDNLRLHGFPYKSLLDDLASAKQLESLDLKKAATKAPKAKDGLNIEGLVARPDGTLLIAFRNPIPGGMGLLLPLLNPAELVNGSPARAKFGEPILLDLDKRGVRDITFLDGTYYIIAGSRKGGEKSQLYTWDGKSAPAVFEKAFPKAMNPEALLPLPSGKEMLILSDDGTRQINGVDCKELKPELRQFRSYLMKLGN